jgi:hypothetical protein
MVVIDANIAGLAKNISASCSLKSAFEVSMTLPDSALFRQGYLNGILQLR